MGGCCSKDTAVHADSSNAHHRRISDVSCGRVSLVGTVVRFLYRRMLYNMCCKNEFLHLPTLTQMQANKTTLETAEQQPRDREDSATPSSVKVAVIVRPLLPFEQQKGGSSSIVVYPPDKVYGRCHACCCARSQRAERGSISISSVSRISSRASKERQTAGPRPVHVLMHQHR